MNRSTVAAVANVASVVAVLSGVLAAGCRPSESGPGTAEAAPPAPPAVARSAAEAERPAPLYWSPAELDSVRKRVAADPALRQALATLLRPAEAAGRASAPPDGAYRTYAPAPPGPAPAWDPAVHSPEFRRLLTDAQTARDLALAYALAIDGPAYGDDPAVSAGDAGRRAVEILTAYSGPGGLRPIVPDRHSALELGVAVSTLYAAADLVWNHPAWTVEIAPESAPGRLPAAAEPPAPADTAAPAPGAPPPPTKFDRRAVFCKWAADWAESVYPMLLGLRGRSLAWGHHLWVASLAVAERADAAGPTTDRLRRALDGTDPVSAPSVLRREVSELGHVLSEEWHTDGPGRAVLTLGAYLLTADVASRRFPELFAPPPREAPDGDPKAPTPPEPAGLLMRRLLTAGLARQWSRLADPAPESAEVAPVGADAGRGARNWYPFARRRLRDLPAPAGGATASVRLIPTEDLIAIGPVSPDRSVQPRPWLPVLGPMGLLPSE